MKIRDKNDDEQLDVLAIFSEPDGHGSVLWYNVIKSKGTSGGWYFSSVSENDAEILDENLGDGFVVKNAFNGAYIVHQCIDTNDLFERLSDGDGTAIREVQAIIKLAYKHKKGHFPITPFDILRRSNAYPDATDVEDTYYFCPNCSDANEKANNYDEAIRCSNCEALYNICAAAS